MWQGITLDLLTLAVAKLTIVSFEELMKSSRKRGGLLDKFASFRQWKLAMSENTNL